MRILVALAAALALSAGAAAQDLSGSAACEQAPTRDRIVDQIRLYSTCIQRGGSRALIANAYIGRGYAHMDLRDWEAAAADFTASIERVQGTGDNYLNPSQVAGIRINRAQALAMMRDLEAAEADVQYALDARSDRGAAHSVRGVLRMMRGDEQGALADFDAAIDLDSRSARLHRAFLLATANDPVVFDPDEAVRVAERALDRDEDSVVARRALAAAYAEQGRFEEAVRLQTEAIEIMAEDERRSGVLPDPLVEEQLALLQAGRTLRGARYIA